MWMSKRVAREVGLAGALLMLTGSALATVSSAARLALGVALAIFGVLLLGAALVVAGHLEVAPPRRGEQLPDELNSF